jgi:serine/threonine protein phosphatase PrpC
MNEPFTFYRAVDPMKGSWDGYGYFASGESDFLAFVTDAPSAASVHTPELIQEFWTKYCRENLSEGSDIDIAKIELADGINRLHDALQKRSRVDGAGYQATLCIARKIGDRLLYCSVGDSVLQLYRGEKLYRLNESEIWDGSLIASESQPLKERQKTQLLRFVGDGGDFVPAAAVSILKLFAGDMILFNSDGMEDLLTPDRLISLMKSRPDQLRNEFERIFLPEKIRDDITFLAVPIQLQAALDPEKELRGLQTQIDGLKKEQTEFRNDLHRLATPGARLERIEKGLTQLSQQMQTLNRKIESQQTVRTVSNVAPRPERRDAISHYGKQRMWLWVGIAFVFGALLAGLLFYALTPQPARTAVADRTPNRTQPERAEERRAEPPEITPGHPQSCEYVVERGDTLQRIATKKKTDLNSLLRWNPSLKRDSVLKVGETVITCEQGL